jgi:glyoxylate/hydroxypyruvate reductase A
MILPSNIVKIYEEYASGVIQMAIAILVGRDDQERQAHAWFIQEWRNALLALQPDLDIRAWPEIGNHQEIDFALVWKHPIGALTEFPHLKAIASLGAGVDHVMVDPHLKQSVPIVRVVDPYMANDIVQYVTAITLHYMRRMDHWAALQKQKKWLKEPPFTLADKTIGIMGLGFLGGKAAHIFKELGLKVAGWRSSPKQMKDMKTYAGETGFAEFLSQSQVLICMLPLTKSTRHILNQHTFAQLPKGAYLINVGRGQHLVEEDLLAALDSQQLSGACLDVFSHEPLPADHPFWTHPQIRVTPHIASVTNAATAAPQVLENYQRLLAGLPLLNLVDIDKGY